MSRRDDPQLNVILDRFDKAWSGGATPEIRDFLPAKADESARRSVLIELIMIDLKRRWRANTLEAATLPPDAAQFPARPILDDYVSRYTELSIDSLPVELIAEEYHVRQSWGDQPGHDEYLGRFPAQATEVPSALADIDKGVSIDATVTSPPLDGLATNIEDETIPLEMSGTIADPSAGNRVRCFGEYELLDEIARGGMGVVFKARQVKLNRIVALKMILSGELAGEEEVQRFKTEAEAAANLDHPGIVPIYEIGEHQGQHYFSMGFVEGQSLADRVKDGPLPPKEAAEIVKKVAEAVAYAHENGVIHRDLKPANVLLDANDEPRVTDFGLAKQVESDSDLTRTGAVMGTPSYMPPEQAGGDTGGVGPRSDVYSLGAILYCLLTGRPPFQSANPMDILLQVLDKEPVSPKSLNSDIAIDLDTVCLKCLQKDPGRRYQSSMELGDELERYLNGQTILARPIGPVQRAWRWCKRNPSLATVGALLIVSLLGGAVFATVFSTIVKGKNRQLTTLNGELEKNNVALTKANRLGLEARKLAEANEKSARQQSQLALSALTSVIQDVQYGLRDLPGGGETRRRLLNTSLAKLESVAIDYVEQSAVDRQTIWALFNMGDLVLELGADDELQEHVDPRSEHSPKQSSAVRIAEVCYRRAYEIAVQSVEEHPQDALLNRDLQKCHLHLGDIQLRKGDSVAALASFKKCHQMAQRMAEYNPRVTETQRDLFVSYGRLGRVQLRMGDSKAALESHKKCLEIAKQLVEIDPSNTKALGELCYAYDGLAMVKRELGDSKAALDLYQESLKFRQKRVAADPSNTKARRLLAFAYAETGALLQLQGKKLAALDLYKKRLEIIESLLRDDSKNRTLRRDQAIAHEEIAAVQVSSGDVAGAKATYEVVAKVREGLIKDDPHDPRAKRDLSVLYGNLGELQLDTRDYSAAVASHQRQMEIRELLTKDDPLNVQAQHDLFVAIWKVGRAQMYSRNLKAAQSVAKDALQKANQLALLDPANARFRRNQALAHESMGDIQRESSDFKAALASYQESLKIREELASADSESGTPRRDVMLSHYRLGMFNKAIGKYDSAAEHFSVALEILRELSDQGRFVAEAKRLIPVLERAVAAAKRIHIALSDWEQLLLQPSDSLPGLLVLRALASIDRERYVTAAHAADKLRELDAATQSQLYKAACVFSLCAASIKSSDDKALTMEQVAQKKAWGNDALSTLKKAIEAGFDDYDRMQGDDDLSAIRERPEFKALIPKED